MHTWTWSKQDFKSIKKIIWFSWNQVKSKILSHKWSVAERLEKKLAGIYCVRNDLWLRKFSYFLSWQFFFFREYLLPCSVFSSPSCHFDKFPLIKNVPEALLNVVHACLIIIQTNGAASSLTIHCINFHVKVSIECSDVYVLIHIRQPERTCIKSHSDVFIFLNYRRALAGVELLKPCNNFARVGEWSLFIYFLLWNKKVFFTYSRL